jgi:hypothetical protein
MADGPLEYRRRGSGGYQPRGDAFWGAVSMLLFAGTLVLCVAGMALARFQDRLLAAQVGTGFVGVFIAIVGTDFDRRKAPAKLGLLLNALAIGCGCFALVQPFAGRP